MSTTNSTTSQPVAALSRFVLAHLLTGIVGEMMFEKGLELDLLQELCFDIQDGIKAGLPKIDLKIVADTVMELDTGKYVSDTE